MAGNHLPCSAYLRSLSSLFRVFEPKQGEVVMFLTQEWADYWQDVYSGKYSTKKPADIPQIEVIPRWPKAPTLLAVPACRDGQGFIDVYVTG